MRNLSFFTLTATQSAVMVALTGIEKLQPASEFEHDRNLIIATILRLIERHGEDWDKNCKYCVEHYSQSLASLLERFPEEGPKPIDDESKPVHNKQSLDILCGELFAYLYEFCLHFGPGYRMPREKFSSYSDIEFFLYNNINNFDDPAKKFISWLLRHGLILNIFGDLTRSNNITTARELIVSVNKLDELAEDVQRHENLLSEYKEKYNFMGLHKGFDQLSEEKMNDRDSARRVVGCLGFLALIPLSIELLVVLFPEQLGIINLNVTNITLLTLSCTGLTVITVYYFRTALLNYNSIKAQLLQIELRKILCGFLKSYSEHRAEMKENDKSALDKFENIIFSNILPDDGKMPATFDGLEALVKLIKEIKGS